MHFLAELLAFIIRPIYNLIENYGITLIIVTILIKLLTIPLTLKSQKSMTKTQMLQPEINKLQEKYKNDRNKLAIEMQKLYKEYDVSPMGGCLPLIFQMFVLFGFIGVIYHPFEYILGMTGGELKELAKTFTDNANTPETNLWGISGVKEYVEKLKGSYINFDFFGIDLTKIPKDAPKEWTVWIFPVLATVLTYLSGIQTQMQQKKNAGKSSVNDQAQQTSNTMMKIMPIMTAIFTVTMPIGMSLYWSVSTGVQIVQQAIMNLFVNEKIKSQVEKTQEEIRMKKEQKHPKKH